MQPLVGPQPPSHNFGQHSSVAVQPPAHISLNGFCNRRDQGDPMKVLPPPVTRRPAPQLLSSVLCNHVKDRGARNPGGVHAWIEGTSMARRANPPPGADGIPAQVQESGHARPQRARNSTPSITIIK
eukprot:6135917-Heterocapsa_arctica.AAC.1